MDILSTYESARAELLVNYSALFELFENNDLFSIINDSDLVYLEAAEVKDDPLMLSVGLFSYKDSTPRYSFMMPRKNVLDPLGDTIGTIALWTRASRELVEDIKRKTVHNFLTKFERSDFELLLYAIRDYDQYDTLGKDSNFMSAAAARKYVLDLEQKLMKKV